MPVVTGLFKSLKNDLEEVIGGDFEDVIFGQRESMMYGDRINIIVIWRFRRRVRLHAGLEFKSILYWLRIRWTNRNPRLIAKYYLDIFFFTDGLGVSYFVRE